MDVRDAVRRAVAADADALCALSRRIHAAPELAF
jgi:metal-dependent amidase/aminoacylase/carboxypeptidase family protein